MNSEYLQELMQGNKTRAQRYLVKAGMSEAKNHAGKSLGLSASLHTLLEAFRYSKQEKWEASNGEKLMVEQRKEIIQAEIDHLEQQKEDHEKGQQEQLELQRSRRQSLEQRRKSLIDQPDPAITSNLDLLRLATIILVIFSVGLYIFYVNVGFRALYSPKIDFSDADSLNRVVSDTGIFSMHNFVNGMLAIFPAFVPFVLFAFGMLLHFLLNQYQLNPHRKWGIIMGALISITLFLDGLLAFKIHDNIGFIQQAMGRETEPFLASSNFWIVISLGFISFLVWSGLLHFWLENRKNLDPERNRLVKLQLANRELEETEEKITEMTSNFYREQQQMLSAINQKKLELSKTEASLYKDAHLGVHNKDLNLYLKSFYTGWLEYLNRLDEDTAACEEAFNTFYQNHFTTHPPRDNQQNES